MFQFVKKYLKESQYMKVVTTVVRLFLFVYCFTFSHPHQVLVCRVITCTILAVSRVIHNAKKLDIC